MQLRSILIVLAIIAGSLIAEEPTPAAPAIEQRFAIVLVSTDAESQNEDLLVFSGGTLSSQGYAESRFEAGKVTVVEKDGARTFEATMTSPRGAEAIWSGTITGERVEGKVLTGVKGRFDVSTFTGTLQK